MSVLRERQPRPPRSVTGWETRRNSSDGPAAFFLPLMVDAARPIARSRELGLAARRRVGVCVHRSLSTTIRSGSVSYVDVGDAGGWNVWPLESGEWAWSASVAANGTLTLTGIEPTEAEAESAAQRGLEGLASDAMAAAQSRREVPVSDGGEQRWDPQA